MLAAGPLAEQVYVCCPCEGNPTTAYPDAQETVTFMLVLPVSEEGLPDARPVLEIDVVVHGTAEKRR